MRVDRVFSRLQHVLWETLSICSRRFSLLRNLVAQLLVKQLFCSYPPHSPPVFEKAHKTQNTKTPFLKEVHTPKKVYFNQPQPDLRLHRAPWRNLAKRFRTSLAIWVLIFIGSKLGFRCPSPPAGIWPWGRWRGNGKKSPKVSTKTTFWDGWWNKTLGSNGINWNYCWGW